MVRRKLATELTPDWNRICGVRGRKMADDYVTGNKMTSRWRPESNSAAAARQRADGERYSIADVASKQLYTNDAMGLHSEETTKFSVRWYSYGRRISILLFCRHRRGTLKNQQRSQKSGFRKPKMAEGRHLEFRLWAIILSSINIFAQNLVPWWKTSRLMRCIGQKSAFRKSNVADGRHLENRKVIIIRSYIEIFSRNLVWWLGLLA